MNSTFRKLVVFFTVFTLLTIFLVTLAGFTVGHAHGLTRFASYIEANIAWFSAIKYSLMAIAVLFYPAIVHKLYSNQPDVNQELVNKYSRRRYILLFFIICELLIAHNLLADLIGFLLN